MEIISTNGDLDVVFVYNEKSGLSPCMGIIIICGDLDCCTFLVFVYKQRVLLPVLICRFDFKICQLRHENNFFSHQK